ncbi:MAG: hypothetical protein IT371_00440 [Deltaproteobacteria bacterium]|nr:hypothetical protein [Deltaproteobacteria bacterium]
MTNNDGHAARVDAVDENALLRGWARTRPLASYQLNRFLEADAELLAFEPSRFGATLAITTDSIDEEIASGLYRDGETIGWVAAMASLSDLAAVNAEPLGLVCAVRLPQHRARRLQRELRRGLLAACEAAGTFLLGGDTSVGGRTASITTTAVGRVPAGAPALRRIGCRAGDALYATGLLGGGATYAAEALLGLSVQPGGAPFRPRARLVEVRAVAPFVRAAMDTSDGLLATVDQLARLNHLGVRLALPAGLLTAEARALCRAHGWPALLPLACHHGEFEVVLAVPGAQRTRFLAAARHAGWRPVLVGELTAELGVRGPTGAAISTAAIRNLNAAGTSPRRYLAELVALIGRDDASPAGSGGAL